LRIEIVLQQNRITFMEIEARCDARLPREHQDQDLMTAAIVERRREYEIVTGFSIPLNVAGNVRLRGIGGIGADVRAMMMNGVATIARSTIHHPIFFQTSARARRERAMRVAWGAITFSDPVSSSRPARSIAAMKPSG